MNKKNRYVVVVNATFNICADNKEEAEAFAEFLEGTLYDELIIDERVIPGDTWSAVQNEGKLHKVMETPRGNKICKRCWGLIERYDNYNICIEK